MSGKKNPTPIPLKSLDALFGTMDEEQTGIQQISLESLHMFEGHPFKVLDDDKMMEPAESVSTHGVLVPGIVRIKDSGGYEIIAGHRRKRACEIAGLKTMPVIIKDLTDDLGDVILDYMKQEEFEIKNLKLIFAINRNRDIGFYMIKSKVSQDFYLTHFR